MYRKILIAILISAILLAACGALLKSRSPDDAVTSPPMNAPGVEDTPPPWSPQPGDLMLERDEATVNQADILVMESFPPQYMLSLQGTLPTPCHQLRIQVSPPDAQQRIMVEVYSLSKPGEICVQVIETFQVQVPLKDLPAGSYTIWVNGEPAGEIDVPNSL